MISKYWKNLDKSLPLYGTGLMRLPTDENGIDYARAKEMFDYAVQNGANYFDTAYFYHGGDSERFFAKASKDYPRESLMLTDKFPAWLAHEPSDVEKIFSEQLERCGTEYFDFYFLHSVGRGEWGKIQDFGIYDFLAKKKTEGIIRNLGFSSHDSPDAMDFLLEQAEWDIVQIQLNYYDWFGNSKNLYDSITKKGLPVIAMEPVLGGRLANLSDNVSDIYKNAGLAKTNAEFALKFVGSLPNIAMVLSGTSTLEQAKENIGIFKSFTPYGEKGFEIAEQAVKEINKFDSVPCTDCRYCKECPAEINIPRLLSSYNDYLRFNTKDGLKWTVNDIQEEKRPDKCTGCGACMETCPQKIDVPFYLEKICETIN